MRAEILPGLWIGSMSLKEQSEFLVDKNIKGFLNLEKDLDYMYQELEFQDVVKQNILKYRIIKLAEYLKEATSYIYRKLSNSEGILLVSKNGYTKTDYLLVAYLMRYVKCPKEIAVKILGSKILEPINMNALQIKALEIFIQRLEK
tara:strand:+ start:497 stop:934 length:438 start_codon:yes stop_codon:yes gene_type:complete